MRAMASPRPVPPCRRVVELSTCEYVEKNTTLLVCAQAHTGVGDLEPDHHPGRHRSTFSTRHDHLAGVSEL